MGNGKTHHHHAPPSRRDGLNIANFKCPYGTWHNRDRALPGTIRDLRDVAKAMAKKIDGPPGFFLATEVTDAEFFALRRAPGGILEFALSPKAVKQLKSSGAVQRPIPPGKTSRFIGDEIVIPTDAFDIFNRLREAGEIIVTPR